MCQVQKSRLCLGCFSCISFNTQDVFGVMPPIFARPLFINVFQPTPASLTLGSKLVSVWWRIRSHSLSLLCCLSFNPSFCLPRSSVLCHCLSPSPPPPPPSVLQGKRKSCNPLLVMLVLMKWWLRWSKCSWCEANFEEPALRNVSIT